MRDDDRGEPDAPDDPTRIRSIAVHREDVVNALEATLRTDRRVVLRVTPPYSGRMRARIHSVGDSSKRDDGGSGETPEAGGSEPVHVDAAEFLESVPPYPEVDETASEFPDADVETRRERHAEAVEAWRETVREAVGGTVALPLGDGYGGGDGSGNGAGDGTHEVDVVALG